MWRWQAFLSEQKPQLSTRQASRNEFASSGTTGSKTVTIVNACCGGTQTRSQRFRRLHRPDVSISDRASQGSRLCRLPCAVGQTQRARFGKAVNPSIGILRNLRQAHPMAIDLKGLSKLLTPVTDEEAAKIMELRTAVHAHRYARDED